MLKIARGALLLCAVAAMMPANSATDIRWIDTWGAAPDSAGPSFEKQTVRQIVQISVGGPSLRIRLSNLFGTAPVTIGPVQLAAHAKGSSIQPDSNHAVTFRGKTALTIAPGDDVLSDPVTFPATALEELAISLYFPVRSGSSTVHSDGIQSTFITSSGDATAATSLPVGEVSTSRFFLTDVEVEVAARSAAQLIVAMGDSITDGDHSTLDRNARWPDLLAARLHADPALAAVAVVNSGIAGNRILNDGPIGSSALSRFDRDVLSKPGVRWIVLLEGINDIGVVETPKDEVSARQIIGGMKSLIARAHKRGFKIVGGTLLAFEGSEFDSSLGEAKRQKINAWIRKAGAFDAIVDFDRATRDPARPERISPLLDGGDHLHPNDAGYEAMAKAIDLRLFRTAH